MEFEGFKDMVQQNWTQDIIALDGAKRITAKFKRVRKRLKEWAKGISQLSISIKATNDVLLFLDAIEESRALTDVEWNGRVFLKQHVLFLLNLQKIYWQQRATIRWVKFGEANSKYFQAKATIKYRVNHIDCLQDEWGNNFRDHQNKATILWKTFKQRLNTSPNS